MKPQARFQVSVGYRGKANKHSMYIARFGKYEKQNSQERVTHVGFGNLPKWAKDNPTFFFAMSDEFERKNGTSYREHLISLPRGLSDSDHHELVKDWIVQELGDKHVYQYAIHVPKALDGGENPHCHLMFSDRILDGIERAPDQFFKRYNSKKPENGGGKKANTGMKLSERKGLLRKQRQRMQDMINKHISMSNDKYTMRDYINAISLQKDFSKADSDKVNFSLEQMKNQNIRQILINKHKSANAVEKYQRNELRFFFPVVKLKEVKNENKHIRATRFKASERAVDESEQCVANSKQRFSKASRWHDKAVSTVSRRKQLSGLADGEIEWGYLSLDITARVGTQRELAVKKRLEQIVDCEQLIAKSERRIEHSIAEERERNHAMDEYVQSVKDSEQRIINSKRQVNEPDLVEDRQFGKTESHEEKPQHKKLNRFKR